MEKKTAENALHEAVQIGGGPTKVANALGVSKQAVMQWRLVPATRVLDLEHLTGISRYDLRPDVFGQRPGQVA